MSLVPWNRRDFLQSVAAAAGSLAAPARLFATRSKFLRGFGQSGNPYKELSVPTVINCWGTVTVLGGSLIRPEVEAVMAQASRHFVRLLELHAAAGARISEMLKLPAGHSALVTSGAAAAIQSGLAGILTGNNQEFVQQLPNLTGMKSEVVIQRAHRNEYESQMRTTGVKIVEVETRDDLRQKISERTAMMHFANYGNSVGQIKVDEWAKLAAEYKVPCLNDAAADTPPVSHLTDYIHMGYDLVVFSGGKAMRGPQCAGLLLGRVDLIKNALLNSSPNSPSVGRGQKVGKEEIVGMIKALELYLDEDHDALQRTWQDRLKLISDRITSVRGVVTAFYVPEVANHVPHMQITWDQNSIRLTPERVSQLLEESEPHIVMAVNNEDKPGILCMNSFMLQPGEEKIVAEKLSRILRSGDNGR
jgi:uncharacterized pyridoxal phosphate-dependent enzyme